MSQEQRTAVAVILSIVVLIGYSLLFAPSPQSPEPGQEPTVSKIPLVSEVSRPLPKSVPFPTSSQPERLLSRETAAASMRWSNRGGLSEWRLKAYHERADERSPRINLVRGPELRHLAVVMQSEDVSFPEKPAYTIDSEGDDYVVFAWRSAEIALRATYRWNPGQPDLPIVNISVEWENLGKTPQGASVGLVWEDAPMSPQQKSGWRAWLSGPPDERHPVGFWEGKRRRIDKEAALAESTGTVYWVGIDERYFVSALVPVGGPVAARLARSADKLAVALAYPKDVLVPGQKQTREFRAYLGPKKREALLGLNTRLEESIDYGWLSLVAVPMLWLLKAFYQLLASWGLAIIALTVFIKFLLNPITRKSMLSMKAMQKLQPELAKLREKYQDNREKLNLEMMQLFRTHKVNPVGGCLPMLLQMPIYIALYKVLYTSVELYHSPFLYYQDLAAPDPYFIAPILLGIFMVLQQKFTPATTMDPTQQKMMMLMPVMFSAFMLFLPAGLVIYIFVNTFMSVIQQVMMQRDLTWRGLFAGKWKKG